MAEGLIARIEAAADDPVALGRIREEILAAPTDPEHAECLERIERYRRMAGLEVESEQVIREEAGLPTRRWTLAASGLTPRRVVEAYIFDPDNHPRNRLGRFIEVIGELSKGESVKIPGGATVKRSPLTGTLSVHDPGARVPATFDSSDAEGAALRALEGAGEDEIDLDDMTDQQLVDHLADRFAQGLDDEGRRIEPIMPLSRLRNVFDGFEHDGMRVAMLPEFDEVHQSGAIHVRGVVENPEGRQVGELHRTATITREGELEVGHATFSLDSSVQGAGFAAALQRHAFDEYREMGFKRVRVSTAEVGGYAWARAGFTFDPLHYTDFDDPPETSARLAGFRGAADTLHWRGARADDPSARPPGVRDWEWDAFMAKVPTRDEVQEAAYSGDLSGLEGKFETEWEIAAFGRERTWEHEGRTMWLGKWVMLNSKWVGAFRLEHLVEESRSTRDATSIVGRLHHAWLGRKLAGHEEDSGFPSDWGRNANLHFHDDDEFWEQVEEALDEEIEEAEFRATLHPRNRAGRFIETVNWVRGLDLDSYLVGGAVRDKLLGKEPKDADFLVARTDVADLKDAVGDAFVDHLDVAGQKVGIRAKAPNGEVIEIVPPRREVSTGPGHQDFEIVPDPTATVNEDLARRDFTINAIAENLKTGRLVDPYGGADDAKKRVLRTVSPDSFRDDPLRIMRGLVRVSADGLTPTDETKEQMRQYARGIEDLTAERVQAEVSKMLMGQHPSQALRLMRDTGTLRYVFPELMPMVGFDQESKYHDLTVDEHTFAVIDATVAARAPLEVRLAALIHDSGKPGSAWRGPDGRLHYYANPDLGKPAHEDLGAEIARGLLERLRYPRRFSDTVEYLVAHHMVPSRKPTPAKARKFVNQHGLERARMILTHRRADMRGKDEGVGEKDLANLDAFDQMVEDASNAPTQIKDLKITGRDLIDLGYKPGPEMKVVLNELLREVLGQPKLNEREWLLRMARKRRRTQVSR